MTDKTDTGRAPQLTDSELDDLLDELKAPPPSDLLRARLHNAGRRSSGAARSGSPAATKRSALRSREYGRAAAALFLAVLVGLAVWQPATTRTPGAAPAPIVAFEPLPPTEDVADLSTAEEADAETGPALALVGGGAAVSGIGLVQGTWYSASASAVAGSDPAEDGELDDIPLY